MKTRRGEVVLVNNLGRRGHPGRVFVTCASAESKSAGLRLDSVIMADNLATILDSEMDSVLGRLPDMSAVDAALKYTWDL